MTSRFLSNGYVLITGGVGFIGTNLTERLVREGQKVVVLDDFSRSGVQANARWISDFAQDRILLLREDCRNAERIAELVQGASFVYHLAAQVAVTTSLLDPMRDFEVNLGGTLNVLEAIRKSEQRPPVLFTSTNKVYGALPGLRLSADAAGYRPVAPEIEARGIDERFGLDFHSPYGCSKGSADQYVLDYARSYGLSGIVFRMSCIYGPHQCGNEDQGWVAHFLTRALARQPITIYGDGLQVRDILFVEDLVDALLLAKEHASELAGRAFNIGGGPTNAVSLLEVVSRISSLTGSRPDLAFESARNGDQRYFVTDTRAFGRACGWAARTSVDAGLARLHAFLTAIQLDLREELRETLDGSNHAAAATESSVGVR